MAQPSQAVSPSPSKQPVSRLGRGGDVGHPCTPAGQARTPLRSPPANKPRARGAGSVREAGADSPAITQWKENTTCCRINSSARGRASKQPLPNGTAPFPGQAWPHHGAGQQRWVPGRAVPPSCATAGNGCLHQNCPSPALVGMGTGMGTVLGSPASPAREVQLPEHRLQLYKQHVL